MGLRGIVLAAFFLGSLPFCFFRPFYGLVLWTIVAFVNPHAYTWGAETLPWAQMVIIPAMLGILVFRRHGWAALRSREAMLIIALGLWFTITTVISINTPLFMHHADDTVQRWSLVSKILLVTILTIPTVNTFSRLRMFVLVIAGCFGLFVLKSLPFIAMTGGSQRLYGPPNSMIADNNDLGLALNMTLPLFFFLAQTESKPWLKRLLIFLVLATIPAILFTYSRGALVGLLSIGVLMFVHLPMRQRLLLTPVILVGVLVAALFAPVSWHDRMKSIGDYSEDRSAQARLSSWKYAINLAGDYPVTGGGFATFTRQLYAQYAPEGTGHAYTAHSVYFQLLAEQGYVGLFLYLTLLGSAFWTASRLSKRAKEYDDTVVVRYANMFRFSLVGFATSGAFLSRAYFDYFFCIIACIIILRQVAFEEWSQDGLDEDGATQVYESGEYVFPHQEVTHWR